MWCKERHFAACKIVDRCPRQQWHDRKVMNRTVLVHLYAVKILIGGCFHLAGFCCWASLQYWQANIGSPILAGQYWQAKHFATFYTNLCFANVWNQGCDRMQMNRLKIDTILGWTRLRRCVAPRWANRMKLWRPSTMRFCTKGGRINGQLQHV